MDELDDSMNDVLANMDIPEDIQPTTSKTSVDSKETSQNKVQLITSAKIQVNSNQKGNPLLKSITNVPWEYNDKIVPDYVVGKHGKFK